MGNGLDWQGIVKTYNEKHNTQYKTHVKLILDLYEEYQYAYLVAKLIGVSHTSVSTQLTLAGAESKRISVEKSIENIYKKYKADTDKCPKDLYQRIYEHFGNMREASEKIDISPTTFRVHMLRLGIPTNKRGGRNNTGSELRKPVQELYKKNPGMTTSEIARRNHCNFSTAKIYIDEIKNADIQTSQKEI